MDIDDEFLLSTDEEEIEPPPSSNRAVITESLFSNASLIGFIMKSTILSLLHIKSFIQNNSSNISISSNVNANPNACSYQEHSRFIQNLQHLLKNFLLFIVKWILIMLRIAQRIFMLIVLLLILVITLPFTILRNIFYFLKCYTGSEHAYYIPFKIIPIIFIHIWSLFAKLFTNKSRLITSEGNFQCLNSNNNVKMPECSKNKSFISKYQKLEVVSSRKIPLLSLFCVLIFFAGFIFAYDNFNGKTFSISRLRKYSKHLFMLPGERCMKAGRCCKGILESIFRWIACFITIPLRILLFLWTKSNLQDVPRYEGMNGIQNYINKVKEEINELKEEIMQQDELILNVQKKYIDLDQTVYEEAGSIDKLKPQVFNSKKLIEELKESVDKSMILLKNIISMRSNIDTMFDSVKLEADDATKSVKVTMLRLERSIETEERRLYSQIENLEIIFRENNVKVRNKNQRILQRINNEINKIKNSQFELTKRILPMLELTSVYKQMSDGLQKDLRNKINQEMVHHEQMNKITENDCSGNIEKLEKNLKDVKVDLGCFTSKYIKSQAQNVGNKLRKDISDSLNERTLEMVKIITEQVIYKQQSHAVKQKVKKCSLLNHVFNFEVEDDQCLLKDKSNLLSFHNVKESKDIIIDETKTKDKIDMLIEETLRVFSADDIGLTDYATESSGGSVISDRSSPTYTGRSAFLSLFGLTFGKVVKSIRKVIQPGTLPGECWAFKHDKGDIVIRLAKPIAITSITIDHVPSNLTPDGRILSAPKNFILYALQSYDDYNGIQLGEFEYSKDDDPIQTFSLIKSSPVIQYVHVKFLSNHGNEEYTCIYRIRIHGNYYENI